MSKVMMRRSRWVGGGGCADYATAGPERTVRTGSRTAAERAVMPPEDCRRRCGGRAEVLQGLKHFSVRKLFFAALETLRHLKAEARFRWHGLREKETSRARLYHSLFRFFEVSLHDRLQVGVDHDCGGRSYSRNSGRI